MVYAIVLGALALLFCFLRLILRSRYNTFACLDYSGRTREKTIKLKKFKSQFDAALLGRINREIKIFNTLRVIMPARRGVAVEYIENLLRLYKNPRFLNREADGFGRLLYLYAAVMLYGRSTDPFVRRQLYKNCLYVFGVNKIIKKLNKPTVCGRKLFAAPRPLFKLLRGKSFSKFIERKPNMRFEQSYTVLQGPVTIKNFVDAKLAAECYEVGGEYKLAHHVGEKSKYKVSHTADTFFCSSGEKCVGIFAPCKKTFGSTFTEKTDQLTVYVNFEDAGKAFIVYAPNKSEVIAVINKIRMQGSRLNYLTDAAVADENRAIEKLYAAAQTARFPKGEHLRERYAAARKFVPTLHLPTLVYSIETAADFFAVVDNFSNFKEIAHAAGNLNVVLLYSSLNDIAREHAEAFTNRDSARSLIDDGVFLFFIDKVRTSSAAVYYLSQMQEASSSDVIGPLTKHKEINIEIVISKTFPITYTAIVNNTSARTVTAAVSIPIELGTPSVIMRKNAAVTVSSLGNGHTSIFRIPNGANIFACSSGEVGQHGAVAERFAVVINTKFKSFEEKIFTITKNENALTPTERKRAFIGSLSGITVTGGAELGKIFALPVGDCPDEKLFDSVKSAIKNVQRDVLFALLAKIKVLPPEVFALLIEKVIGLKTLRGTIQIVPNIAITGGFELGFTYNGQSYNFTVNEKAGGFSVRHNNQEYKNFLQISV